MYGGAKEAIITPSRRGGAGVDKVKDKPQFREVQLEQVEEAAKRQRDARQRTGEDWLEEDDERWRSGGVI